MTIREDVERAFDQRLREIRCSVWGRNFQLHNEEDRARAIEYILSFVEPALKKAGLAIFPVTTQGVNAYVWQYDREPSEKDTHTSRQLDQVDSTDGTTGENRLFQNGLC